MRGGEVRVRSKRKERGGGEGGRERDKREV